MKKQIYLREESIRTGEVFKLHGPFTEEEAKRARERFGVSQWVRLVTQEGAPPISKDDAYVIAGRVFIKWYREADLSLSGAQSEALIEGIAEALLEAAKGGQ